MDRSVQWSVDQVHRGVHGPGVSVLGSPRPRGRYRRDLFALLQIPNNLNTKFDLRYLLCNLYVWMWFSTNSFLSVLWWRGVSKLIWYRLTGILDKHDGVRFLFSVQVIEKAQKKESFSLWNCFSRNSTLFSLRRSAWPVLKCNQGSDVLKNFELPFLLYGQGNLCIYKCFIDV